MSLIPCDDIKKKINDNKKELIVTRRQMLSLNKKS